MSARDAVMVGGLGALGVGAYALLKGRAPAAGATSAAGVQVSDTPQGLGNRNDGATPDGAVELPPQDSATSTDARTAAGADRAVVGAFSPFFQQRVGELRPFKAGATMTYRQGDGSTGTATFVTYDRNRRAAAWLLQGRSSPVLLPWDRTPRDFAGGAPGGGDVLGGLFSLDQALKVRGIAKGALDVIITDGAGDAAQSAFEKLFGFFGRSK